MQNLPVFMNIRNRPCLVVGGGGVAARKVELLLRAHGKVTVVSPALGDALKTLHEEGAIDYRACEFQPADIAGCDLVIAATDHQDVNRAVYESALQAGIPVNVVDTPERCSFTFGAVVDRDPVTIAVSSAGQSPVLTRAVRAAVETHIPAAFGRLAALVKRYRDQVKRSIPGRTARARFWKNIVNGPVAEQVFAGRNASAEQRLQDDLAHPEAADNRTGEVYLIGAGAGDPDLLTFRALRLIQKADILFHDRRVPDVILDFARPDAERFYIGKQRDDRCVPQSDINALLVKYAREGKTVARIQGGDPFLFGRGGEEAEALAEHGIDFQVVPAITTAAGCGAYAGIPLTHRDYSQACRFISGHDKDGELDLDWVNLATQSETLVFHRALRNLGRICAKLVEHGLPQDFPIAVIEQGAQRRVVTGTLADIEKTVEEQQVRAPAVVIVGNVVALREKLQ